MSSFVRNSCLPIHILFLCSGYAALKLGTVIFLLLLPFFCSLMSFDSSLVLLRACSLMSHSHAANDEQLIHSLQNELVTLPAMSDPSAAQCHPELCHVFLVVHFVFSRAF